MYDVKNLWHSLTLHEENYTNEIYSSLLNGDSMKLIYMVSKSDTV